MISREACQCLLVPCNDGTRLFLHSVRRRTLTSVAGTCISTAPDSAMLQADFNAGSYLLLCDTPAAKHKRALRGLARQRLRRRIAWGPQLLRCPIRVPARRGSRSMTGGSPAGGQRRRRGRIGRAFGGARCLVLLAAAWGELHAAACARAHGHLSSLSGHLIVFPHAGLISYYSLAAARGELHAAACSWACAWAHGHLSSWSVHRTICYRAGPPLPLHIPNLLIAHVPTLSEHGPLQAPKRETSL